jgi:hypothetical protein
MIFLRPPKISQLIFDDHEELPKIIYAYFQWLFLAAKNNHFLGFKITPNFNLYIVLSTTKSHNQHIHNNQSQHQAQTQLIKSHP